MAGLPCAFPSFPSTPWERGEEITVITQNHVVLIVRSINTYIMRKFFAALYVLINATCAYADPYDLKLPEHPQSVDEIIQSFEAQKGSGYPAWVHAKSIEREFFVIWSCPYSGIESVFVFVYEKKGGLWKIIYNDNLFGTSIISVEYSNFDHPLILRSEHGKILKVLRFKPTPPGTAAQ